PLLLVSLLFNRLGLIGAAFSDHAAPRSRPGRAASGTPFFAAAGETESSLSSPSTPSGVVEQREPAADGDGGVEMKPPAIGIGIGETEGPGVGAGIVTGSGGGGGGGGGPTPSQMMAMMGTSPRRVFTSAIASTGIALSANLFGVTSSLLTALPEEVVEPTGLDTYFPRDGFKRVVARGSPPPPSLGANGLPSAAATGGGGSECSFLIPKDWVADTSLALAQAQRRARALDYSMRQPSSSGVLPDAAFGPPGKRDGLGLSNEETNVSVIVNNDVSGFTLRTLGDDAESAARSLLSKRKRPTELVAACEEVRGANTPVYQFEYTVDRGERYERLRAISVVAGSSAGDSFVTLTVVSADADWAREGARDRLKRNMKELTTSLIVVNLRDACRILIGTAPIKLKTSRSVRDPGRLRMHGPVQNDSSPVFERIPVTLHYEMNAASGNAASAAASNKSGDDEDEWDDADLIHKRGTFAVP
ncbi:hypothetical protein THAOC_15420, partial [Thalassiosira oceanica]